MNFELGREGQDRLSAREALPTKMRPAEENVKKVAVIMEDQMAQFVEFDQSRPLAAIIKDLCDNWYIKNADDYCLQSTEYSRPCFVTERNRHDIQNGNVLKLTFSAAKTTEQILGQLQTAPDAEKTLALRQLASLAVDSTFAQEFINRNGHEVIIGIIEQDIRYDDSYGYTLRAFVDLMEHGFVSWVILDENFVKMISRSVTGQNCDPRILQSALEIMENIVLHSSELYVLVEEQVTPACLIKHLDSSNSNIQKNAIALINALFLKAEADKRLHITENLHSKNIRSVIMEKVLQNHAIGAEMAHQLYVLQRLMFHLLENRRTTSIDINDQQTSHDIIPDVFPCLDKSSRYNALREINDLRTVAFGADSEVSVLTSKRDSHARDYRKLGFKNTVVPLEDFLLIPPGLLAYDMIMHFSKFHKENFTQVVLENCCRMDDHDMPFVQASIFLTNMLCEILNVGELPTDDGQVYYSLFFTTDQPFEQLYCSCIQLLNRTWKDMKATSADFTKVLRVVREQITRALSTRPSTFAQFQDSLSKLTYSLITQLWQNERLNMEVYESSSRPIRELRKQIGPEVIEVIKKQRLYFLVQGSMFNKFSTKGIRMKDKFWYCRLSLNHKVLHYGDKLVNYSDEKTVPSTEQLQNKLAIVDIKSLLIGKDCPNVKDRSKKTVQPSRAFSILPDDGVGDAVNFIAQSDKELHMWCDAINALIGCPMTSDLYKQDLERLLTMEMKLRLLDTEGLTIPDAPPAIPPLPTSYDFPNDPLN